MNIGKPLPSGWPGRLGAAAHFYAAFRPLFRRVGRWRTGIPSDHSFRGLLRQSHPAQQVVVAGSHSRRQSSSPSRKSRSFTRTSCFLRLARIAENGLGPRFEIVADGVPACVHAGLILVTDAKRKTRRRWSVAGLYEDSPHNRAPAAYRACSAQAPGRACAPVH